ncbi:hypothetical protein Pmar_PMAR019309 [Perkinsus marinus ATCC 50983]|uniref:sphingomyelin phosphodiesterase n=1 Tax=Perkinsus marinus (strain ATCC 50983 / TXsc) TaxID=423536 RepID=C5KFS8_PERM5|nr:hypothetical protein Pmar_PMAR019309 [Perkinsus marinus ATCC 50983]EER16630.1 hypothetical protein Pmar_PMAR019309 [Perkinsus marinus ATCC 50983]|eukprot:XP_002784834.1 hypothetical protein Pmar_PMAR019309 [Perkinsus marinus ATCC 50983]
MDYILNRGVGGGIGGGFGSMLRQSMCRCLPYGWSTAVIGNEPDDDDLDELEILHETSNIVDNVRILSYNIFIRPPAPRFTHNVDDDYKDQRLEEFIKFYLQRYHVVCLQEMFGAFSARRKRLIARARRMGFRWKVTSPQRRSSGFLVDGGCIILSRLRIVRSRAIVYQPGVFSDQLAAKVLSGALYALLNPAPGVFIHLFSTHLQASYSDKAGEVAAKIRQSQIDELVDFIKKCTSEENINAVPCMMMNIEDILSKPHTSSALSTTDSYNSPSAADMNRPPTQEVIGRPSDDPSYHQQEECDSINRCCNNEVGPLSRKHPIVLVGDFNCNARTNPHNGVDDSDEFKLIISKLRQIGVTHDVLFEELGEHPVTYASADFDVTTRSSAGALEYTGAFVPSETALTDPIDWTGHGEQTNQSLDYIFYFPSATTNIVDNKATPSVSVKSAKVNSFHLTQRRGERLYALSQATNDPLQEFGFTQLSDHYGVEVELSLTPEERDKSINPLTLVE